LQPAVLKWLSGEQQVRTFKVPEAKRFTNTFCATCGGRLPRQAKETDIVMIPAGSLDDEPPMKPQARIAQLQENAIMRGNGPIRPTVVDRARPTSNRWSSRLRLRAALAFAMCLPVAALAAGDPPPLRAGLWEARTSFPSRPEVRAGVTRMCIDPQTQRRMLQQASLAMFRMCSRHEYGMHAGRFVTNSHCAIAGAIVEGRSETTFYRDTAYHTEVVGRIMPAGRTAATQKTIIDARHVGKCPAGMKAGDMTLPNGQHLNLVELSAAIAR
jgi:hypothetical protein